MSLIKDNSVKVTLDKSVVLVGNKSYDIEAMPYIQPTSKSILVPLRFVAIALSEGSIKNADNSSIVSWDGKTKSVTINIDDKVVKFTAGSDIMIINGKKTVMDNSVQAEISGGRMFVPFRALGNALGVEVSWDDTTKTATYSLK